MFGVVDLFGFFDWTMVKPENDIVIVGGGVEVWSGHTDRLIGVVSEDGEGASGIETNASNRVGIDVVLSDGPVDRGADTTPDVGCGLFLLIEYGLLGT